MLPPWRCSQGPGGYFRFILFFSVLYVCFTCFIVWEWGQLMHPGVNVLYFHEAGNAFSLGKTGWLAITSIIIQEKIKMVWILGMEFTDKDICGRRPSSQWHPSSPKGKGYSLPSDDLYRTVTSWEKGRCDFPIETQWSLSFWPSSSMMNSWITRQWKSMNISAATNLGWNM